MTEQALSDVKVLDLTWHIAGPYCTKLFADYGADVIKIEKPGEGDPARRMPPFFKDDPHPEKSGLFLDLNTNKRSITLNLKSKTGQKIFKELVKDMDIVVESFSPHVMPSLGLSYEEMEKINPSLVMTSVSNFGQTGPYRDYEASDLTEEGMGHALYARGDPAREPQKLNAYAMQYQGGNTGATATMFAFYAARYKGIGQHVDVSIMECGLSAIDMRPAMLLSYQYTGLVSTREPNVAFGILPFGVYPCSDGFLEVGVALPQWARVVKMLEMPDLPERFPNLFDMERKGELDAIILPWFAERTKQEVMEIAQAQRVYITAVQTPGDLVEDPHFKERQYWAEIDHPVTGELTYPGAPFKSEETPWQVRRPAPLLGQHNDEVYRDKLGYSKDDLVKLRERGII